MCKLKVLACISNLVVIELGASPHDVTSGVTSCSLHSLIHVLNLIVSHEARKKDDVAESFPQERAI